MDRFSIIILLCFYTAFKIAESQELVCTEIGFFEINDGTCKNFYLCLDNGARLIPVMVSCTSSTIFDPVQGRCVPQNTTTCQQTPRCIRYGRFPIVGDVECKMYYLCYWNGTAYSIMDNLSCPNSLVFNPTTEKCVSPQLYQCPG